MVQQEILVDRQGGDLIGGEELMVGLYVAVTVGNGLEDPIGADVEVLPALLVFLQHRCERRRDDRSESVVPVLVQKQHAS